MRGNDALSHIKFNHDPVSKGDRPRIARQGLDLSALREQRMRHVLAAQIAALPGAAALTRAHCAAAAERYLAQAMQQDFSLDAGAGSVGLMCAGYGVGFVQDAQYPQMAALFRADIRTDEGWRLALLNQWKDWHAIRQVAASPAATIARLRLLAALIAAHGVAVLAHDPAAVYAALDPAKAALHDAGHWRRVAGIWQAHFAKGFANAAQFQIDYACAIAFCCGQYFPYDPLWDSLSDLDTTTLNSLVKRSVSDAG